MHFLFVHTFIIVYFIFGVQTTEPSHMDVTISAAQYQILLIEVVLIVLVMVQIQKGRHFQGVFFLTVVQLSVLYRIDVLVSQIVQLVSIFQVIIPILVLAHETVREVQLLPLYFPNLIPILHTTVVDQIPHNVLSTRIIIQPDQLVVNVLIVNHQMSLSIVKSHVINSFRVLLIVRRYSFIHRWHFYIHILFLIHFPFLLYVLTLPCFLNIQKYRNIAHLLFLFRIE